MCISNFGNARRFPTGAAATAAKPVQSNEMTNRIELKDLDLSAFEPKPMADKQHPVGHIIVQHDYHDHSHDSRSWYQEEHPARGGVTTPFPLKLHDMLDSVMAEGNEHIVSWQPHGRSFLVHKPKEFVELLPRYFKLSKLASFQRQLNLYGFQRLTKGRDRGGYYHELFLRGKVFLSHNIQRVKVKGTGVRARSNPEQEPNFWSMNWVAEEEQPSQPLPTASSQQIASLTSIVDQTIAHLPLQQQTPFLQDEQDLVASFGKNFHYLNNNVDPFEPMNAMEQPKWTRSDAELLETEAETFFQDFDFPENIGSEIEDDDVFGDILESLIS